MPYACPVFLKYTLPYVKTNVQYCANHGREKKSSGLIEWGAFDKNYASRGVFIQERRLIKEIR